MSDLPFVDTDEFVDDETGEITEEILGDVDLALIAARALEATEQEKLWDLQKRRLNGILAARQLTKREVYGDVLVNLGFSTRLDRPRLRALIEDAGLDDDEIFAFLAAAVSFATSELSPRLKAMVDSARVPGDPFAKTSRLRKIAPKEEDNNGI